MLKVLIVIGSGSFLGGILRYLATRFAQTYIFSTFPYGTFLVNILGCLLIGIFYGLFERNHLLNSDLRLFLTVGFCGGFTTFSSFSNENLLLLKDGNFFYFALYTALSVFLGLLATWGGSIIIKIV